MLGFAGGTVHGHLLPSQQRVVEVFCGVVLVMQRFRSQWFADFTSVKFGDISILRAKRLVDRVLVSVHALGRHVGFLLLVLLRRHHHLCPNI